VVSKQIAECLWIRIDEPVTVGESKTLKNTRRFSVVTPISTIIKILTRHVQAESYGMPFKQVESSGRALALSVVTNVSLKVITLTIANH